MKTARESIAYSLALALSAGLAGAGPFEDGAASDPYPAGYKSNDLFQGTGSVAAAPSSGASSYTPDDEPALVILAFVGYTNNNDELGRAGWWQDLTDDGFQMSINGNQTTIVVPSVPGNSTSTASNGIVDSVDYLLNQLQTGYDKGYRRFIINRPVGFHEDLDSGVGNLTNASWWVLDESLREDLEDDSTTDGTDGGLAWWIDQHTDATVGIYTGFRGGDPWSSFHSEEYLDADRRDDAWAMYRNIKPWADLGVTEFVFDAVGGMTDSEPEAEARSDSLHRLRAHSAFSGLYISGEHPVATKVAASGGGFEPSGDLDEDRAEDNPWFIDAKRLSTHSVDADEEWDITLLDAEINVGFDYSASDPARDFSRDDIARIVDRGFTAWAWGETDDSVELIRWVYYDSYSSPTLTPSCLGDLDMDGDIDSDDGQIIIDNDAINLASPRPWEGDLDVDGDVDSTDYVYWLVLKSAGCP